MSDFFTRLLFEDLSVLVPVELVAMAVVIAVHRRLRTSRSRLAVGGALAICVSLVALQQFVVTDREAIRAMVEEMATAVQEGDVDGLGRCFADDLIFESNHGKKAVLQRARAVLQLYDINNARVSGFTIEVLGDDAKADFQAMADIRGSGEPSYSTPTHWKLQIRREPMGWRVYRAKYELGLGGLRF